MSGRPLMLSGIRTKLLVSFSLLITSIALFVFIFFPARLERQSQQAVMAKARAISDVTAYSLSAGLFFGDSTSVQEVLAGAARAPDIEVVIVRDSVGHIVAASERGIAGVRDALTARPGTVSADGALYFFSSPIVHDRARIGALTVGISLEGVHADVANARRLGALVGVLIFAIGFAVVYAISTLVTRPLTAVSHTVERIAAGDLSVRAVETSDAEVAQLVRAFNRMVDKLAGAQAELMLHNVNLEARVDARTSELRHAIDDQEKAWHAAIRSEAQARATSETLQLLFDVAPQAILVVDLDWRVTRWNRAAEKLSGWTAFEVIGKPLPIVPFNSPDDFRNRSAAIESGLLTNVVECVRQKKDGTHVTVLVAAGAQRDVNQNVVGYVSVITDLSERKSLENQLHQSQKMEAIGRLAGGVAHDFNNMLTVITSSAALLRDTIDSIEARDNVDAIATAALRASALTRQLLLFSRKQVVHLVPLNTNDVVADMSPMLRRLIRENIQYRTVLDERLGDVKADPTQLQQVIMNLVVNASDAMPAGGTLTIETRNVDLDADYSTQHAEVVPGPYVRLTVSDDGVGMDADTMGKIFEPFFTTKAPGVGTGLGLATTYAVVTQLGGHLRVYSEVGQGTALKIFLPRLANPATRVRQTPRAVPALTAALESVTVLLVEDEPTVRQAIRRTLERLGHAIVEASDGEAALAIAASQAGQIDIVLTDIMMPGMNGRTFADHLAITNRDLPVIFMSGYTDDTVNQRGLIDDTHAFLQKPFSGEQLARTIRELLQEGAEACAVGSATANSSVGGKP